MEFFTGGYFIIKGFEQDKSEYIPNNYFTVSNCIADIIPDTWAWDETFSKKEKNRIKEDYNLTDKQIEILRYDTRNLMKNNEFQLPYVFPSVNIARQFYDKHFSQIKNVKILGIALNLEYTNEFLSEEGNDDFGVSINLTSHSTIDSNGKFIGYELLGYEYWSFHTMYCHSNLISYCKNELNIHFNSMGLIDSFEDAEEVISCIRKEKVGAEPALWEPWAVYEYNVR